MQRQTFGAKLAYYLFNNFLCSILLATGLFAILKAAYALINPSLG
jgi:hypothetical protein